MRGHIVQRAPGSWSIVLNLGQDENGKYKQKWVTVKGTKKEAQRELSRLLRELDTGTYVEPAKLTVGQFLDRWLSDCARLTVSGKTYERYAQIVGTNINPALGHLQLGKLQPLHVQGFYAEALTAGRRDGRAGGLSPTTVLQFHRILREALQQAVKWQLLARNPADMVDPPRAAKPEQRALCPEGTRRLFEEVRNSTLYLPVILAAATGMRRGEICGLRWEDLVLRPAACPPSGTLHVRRSLEVTKAGLVFKPPKTAKGRRSIALPALAVETLLSHRERQAELRELLGPAWKDYGLVVAEADGSPRNPDLLSWQYANWMKRHPHLPRIRFQDLRHTHATLLLLQGENPKVVSERLGHSSVQITLDVYSHVLPGMQEGAASRLDAALRGSAGSTEHTPDEALRGKSISNPLANDGKAAPPEGTGGAAACSNEDAESRA